MITSTITSTAEELRPTRFSDFIGQTKTVEEIELEVEASFWSDPPRPMPHVLLTGPPGSGKTTLARLIALRRNEPFEVINMPFQPVDYRKLLVFDGGVLFLDEIHRGKASEQQDLMLLLEQGLMPIRGIEVPFPWLTVIGATTEPMKVIPPLRDRFPIRPHFDPYTDDEMTRILLGMAGRLGVELTGGDAAILARAAAGQPRMAATLVQTALALRTTNREVDPLEVLRIKRLDLHGLGPKHHAYLDVLWDHGPTVGLRPLANILDVNEAELRALERVLIYQKLIVLSGQGRQLTTAGVARVRQQKGATP